MIRARDRHVVVLLGRFGNQLFQYSFARWLERETQNEVRFDISMTRKVGIAGSEDFVEVVESLAVAGSRNFPAPGGRLGSVGGYLRRALGPSRIVVDMTASGGGDHDFGAPAWWVGYWQQLRFADAARDELRHLLQIPPAQTDGTKRIAVHVRRGDYVGLGLALTPDWYRTAVEWALAMHGDAEVTVVSDDPRWCTANLQFDVPFSVASGAAPLDDFRLLANADVMIASASTFSWWAGYLGGQSIVYPDLGLDGMDVPQGWLSVPATRSSSSAGGKEA